MNKTTIHYTGSETQIKVNDEYIGTIQGELKPDMPILNHSNGEKSQRYGNENGYVWVSL